MLFLCLLADWNIDSHRGLKSALRLVLKKINSELYVITFCPARIADSLLIVLQIFLKNNRQLNTHTCRFNDKGTMNRMYPFVEIER